ncbi:MAG: DUF2800 domain-containing protein [Burkholderia gladioli]
MSAHALLSPSSAHRWLVCAGSTALCIKQPGSPSEYAAEGTAAHTVAAACLLDDNRDPSDFIGQTFEIDGFTIEFDENMAEDLAPYIATVRDYAAYGELLVEQEVPIGHVTGEPGATGTSDAIVLTDDELICIDLKFGRGVQVDADENPQLMLYALGALERFGNLGDFQRVRLVIHQPRIGHLSEWACSVDALHAFAERARAAAQENTRLLVEPPHMSDLIVSDKGCRFCSAKAVCPKLASHVEETLGAEFDDLDQLDQTASPLTADDLARIYPALALIESWGKAVLARIEHELLNGHDVPGTKLVQGRRGARQWSSADEAETLLKTLRLKSDEMYNRRVITPTQAEKLLAKDFPRKWKRAEALVIQREGAPSVAPESDKRPALVIQHPEADFEAIAADDGSDLL